MVKQRQGFMLLEAVLAVVIVSVCLTFIAQALLTNFRTGLRFGSTVKSLLQVENQLGLVCATHTTQEAMDSIDDHLKKITLRMRPTAGMQHNALDVTTIVYIPHDT